MGPREVSIFFASRSLVIIYFVAKEREVFCLHKVLSILGKQPASNRTLSRIPTYVADKAKSKMRLGMVGVVQR